MKRIAWLQDKAVRDVGEILTALQVTPAIAGGCVGRVTRPVIPKVIQVETSLRIAKVQVMGGEEPMSLGTDIADGCDHIFRDLTFETDVVLLRVLRFQLLRNLTEEQNGAELRPVDRGSWGRRKKSVERVRNSSPTL